MQEEQLLGVIAFNRKRFLRVIGLQRLQEVPLSLEATEDVCLWTLHCLEVPPLLTALQRQSPLERKAVVSVFVSQTSASRTVLTSSAQLPAVYSHSHPLHLSLCMDFQVLALDFPHIMSVVDIQGTSQPYPLYFLGPLWLPFPLRFPRAQKGKAEPSYGNEMAGGRNSWCTLLSPVVFLL